MADGEGFDPTDNPNEPDPGTIEQDPTPGEPDDPSASFLSSLPEGLQTALEGADAADLENLQRQTMLRSDYDRKRGEEAKQLREAELKIARLEALVEAGQTAQAPEVPAGPDLDELGKTMFQTRDPEEFAQALHQFSSTVAQEAAQAAVEGSPTMQSVRRAQALQQARADEGLEGVTDQDWVKGLEGLESTLIQRGLDPARVHPEVIKLLAPQAAMSASLERRLQEAQANGNDRARRTPRRTPTGGTATTPPAAGAGTANRTRDPKDNPYSRSDATMDEKLAYLLDKNGLTREDLSRMHTQGDWGF